MGGVYCYSGGAPVGGVCMLWVVYSSYHQFVGTMANNVKITNL